MLLRRELPQQGNREYLTFVSSDQSVVRLTPTQSNNYVLSGLQVVLQDGSLSESCHCKFRPKEEKFFRRKYHILSDVGLTLADVYAWNYLRFYLGGHQPHAILAVNKFSKKDKEKNEGKEENGARLELFTTSVPHFENIVNLLEPGDSLSKGKKLAYLPGTAKAVIVQRLMLSEDLRGDNNGIDEKGNFVSIDPLGWFGRYYPRRARIKKQCNYYALHPDDLDPENILYPKHYKTLAGAFSKRMNSDPGLVKEEAIEILTYMLGIPDEFVERFFEAQTDRAAIKQLVGVAGIEEEHLNTVISETQTRVHMQHVRARNKICGHALEQNYITSLIQSLDLPSLNEKSREIVNRLLALYNDVIPEYLKNDYDTIEKLTKAVKFHLLVAKEISQISWQYPDKKDKIGYIQSFLFAQCRENLPDSDVEPELIEACFPLVDFIAVIEAHLERLYEKISLKKFTRCQERFEVALNFILKRDDWGYLQKAQYLWLNALDIFNERRFNTVFSPSESNSYKEIYEYGVKHLDISRDGKLLDLLAYVHKEHRRRNNFEVAYFPLDLTVSYQNIISATTQGSKPATYEFSRLIAKAETKHDYRQSAKTVGEILERLNAEQSIQFMYVVCKVLVNRHKNHKLAEVWLHDLCRALNIVPREKLSLRSVLEEQVENCTQFTKVLYKRSEETLSLLKELVEYAFSKEGSFSHRFFEKTVIKKAKKSHALIHRIWGCAEVIVKSSMSLGTEMVEFQYKVKEKRKGEESYHEQTYNATDAKLSEFFKSFDRSLETEDGLTSFDHRSSVHIAGK